MTRLFPALLALSFLSLFPPQSGAGTELYGGVGAGYSTLSIDDLRFEGADYSTRQFVGFRYGDYVGIEVGFTDFGSVDDRVGFQAGQPSLTATLDTWGYSLSLVGSYPLNEALRAFGKAGLIRWDSETRLETVQQVGTGNGDDLMYGVGLDYRGTGRFHVRVEFELVEIDIADSWWTVTTSLIYAFPLSR